MWATISPGSSELPKPTLAKGSLSFLSICLEELLDVGRGEETFLWFFGSP
jgi:hypothetical protein